jgi:hypothetical protein
MFHPFTPVNTNLTENVPVEAGFQKSIMAVTGPKCIQNGKNWVPRELDLYTKSVFQRKKEEERERERGGERIADFDC